MSQLSVKDKQMLLLLARQSLADYFSNGQIPQYEAYSPALLELRATFVTLRRRDSGELRGCRGESVAKRPLLESITHMVIASATNDPRFPPITPDELPLIHIEINVLTAMQPVQPEEIVVGKHGLMIMKGVNAGLLLPEVPVRYSWERNMFLQGLCRKAHLAEDAWKSPEAQLFCFETEVWAEEAE